MADETTMQTGDDPGDFTVEQVQAHLDGADKDERTRVLDAERAGKARVGILGSGETPEDTTKGQTFSEAAKAATPDEVGYLGFSPEAERTGRADKGLSQANPAIMRGGPVPDVRASVDDSEALAALKSDTTEG